MTEHKKTLGQADADGGETSKAASSGGHLALVDIKAPASSPQRWCAIDENIAQELGCSCLPSLLLTPSSYF